MHAVLHSGKRIRLSFRNVAGPWNEIFGIVGHISNDMPGADSRPQVYFPQSQRAQDPGVLVVRTQGDPAQLTSAVIEQIRAENPDQAVYDVRTMRDWLDFTLASRNPMTSVISMFSGAALCWPAWACLE